MPLSLTHIQDFEEITLRVNRVEQMSGDQRNALVEKLNQYGCVVIHPQQTSAQSQELLSLTQLCGSPIHHDRSQGSGISTITPCPEDTGYAALTYNQHLPHTDCSYQPVPPPLVALQCEVPAPRGGLSILVPGEDLHRYLEETDPQGLRLMYEKAALQIQREQKIYTRSIFSQTSQGWITIAYKVEGRESAFTLKTSKPLEKTRRRVDQFLTDPRNQFQLKLQIGQILLFDNTRVLHGRTAIEPSVGSPARKINRLWFDGQGVLADQLQLGFRSGSEAQGDQAA